MATELPPRTIVRLAPLLTIVMVLTVRPALGQTADASGDRTAAPAPSGAKPKSVDDLLNMDLEQLGEVRVAPGKPAADAGPGNSLNAADIDFSQATTTGELAKELPGVTTRRTSAINLDPRIRGYHSSQVNSTANGMNELKTRVDIDSAFSQIDPGIVHQLSAIDGPYTPLYGPGFAFLMADLYPALTYRNGFEAHTSPHFAYGTNGQTLYFRDSVWGGGGNWGTYLSYGVRQGNDYRAGGETPEWIPASYQKWDGYAAFRFDLTPYSRIEFNQLRTEMNDVELPGVVYDLNYSGNDQFNLRYVIQDDPRGPEQLVVQSWFHQTRYYGDSLRASKQRSLYHDFFTLPAYDDAPVNTLGQGQSRSYGARLLRTFGEAEQPQWTVGVDWRRYEQRYLERNFNDQGSVIFDGNYFGIPGSTMDDFGVLSCLTVPLTERLEVSVGGRVDQAISSLNAADPVITQVDDPAAYYYEPGFDEPQYTLGMAYLTGKYKLTPEFSLNAGTAFAMRAPDLAELYSDEPYVPLARVGNSYAIGLSSLEPEKDLQIDFGIEYHQKPLRYGVRGFHATVWDYIMPVAAWTEPTPPDFIAAPRVLGRNFSAFPPQYRTDLGTANENADTVQAGYQYVNLDRATLVGGDLYAEYWLTDWFSLYGNMAYVRGTNQHPVAFLSDPSQDSRQGTLMPLGGTEGLPGIYPLTGLAAIRLREPLHDKWGVEFSSRMTARQTHVAASISELPTGGFAVFDLQGYYAFREHVRFTLAVTNLLNKDYTEHGSLVLIGPAGLPTFVREPGTSVLMGVEGRF